MQQADLYIFDSSV